MTALKQRLLGIMVDIVKTRNSKIQITWIHMTFIIVLLILVYVFVPRHFPQKFSYFSSTKKSSHKSWLNANVTIIGIEDVKNFNQKDPRLMNYIKSRHLTPPSTLPYSLSGKFSKKPEFDAEINGVLRTIFKNATKGFFVECGAFDGISSNTLFLEMDLAWSGLLIECNPVLIPELRKAHRKAFVSDVCVSVTETSTTINISSMDSWPASSSVSKDDIFPQNIKSTFTRFEVPAFPFYSIIAATGVTVVDYISLDVQSIEWKVIKNFPFDAILVKVWIVEVVLLSPEEQESMKSLMKQNNYRDPIEIGFYRDYLFIHNSVHMDPSMNIKSSTHNIPPKEEYRGKYATR